ncbi:MAG: prolyl oligopeptidase family serine peptidase, partial [Geodermatophilaceae bacterium]
MTHDSMPHNAAGRAHPFAELADYNAIPRLGGLALSPDGSRLVTAVAMLDPEKKKWQTALWEVDPSGKNGTRRLTRGATGESSPAFTPSGELLFSSARPDAEAAKDAKDAEEPKPGLWALPAGGGEARLVLSRPGGVSAIVAARNSDAVAVVAAMNPGATDGKSDAERRKARKDAGVTALLHEDYPVRSWDRDLGPAWPHVLFLAEIPAQGPARDPAIDTEPADPDADRPTERSDDHSAPDSVEIRDLTPEAGLTSLGGGDLALSPDGTRIARTVEVSAGAAHRRTRIELVDTSSAASRVVAESDNDNFGEPAFSPDGAVLVCYRETNSSYDEPPDQSLWLIDLATGSGLDLTPDLDLWPGTPTWSPDGSGVYFTATELGHHPVFRVELDSGAITRLTASGYYSDLQVATDGSALYALRSAYDSPFLPVRLDPSGVDQQPVTLPSPGAIEQLPGTLQRIETKSDDGTTIRSWLVLPEGASSDSPPPLLLWIHGGPLMSWNAWSWRWCPWLMSARGYAILLPDPALSDGYGQDFVRRGWGQWGGTPYTDLMAATDAALERPEIDQTRTAA